MTIEWIFRSFGAHCAPANYSLCCQLWVIVLTHLSCSNIFSMSQQTAGNKQYLWGRDIVIAVNMICACVNNGNNKQYLWGVDVVVAVEGI